MTTTQMDLLSTKPDRAIGLAAGAWERLCASTGRAFMAPTDIEALKPQRPGRKSGVYRLKACGDGGATIVAKRCHRETAAIERAIHELLLRRIDVATVRYYGYADEAHSEFCWLFMEDVGDAKLFEQNRPLAARWLARLHASAAALADVIPLPERGTSHYHEHVRAARAMLVAIRHESSLAQADREMLRALKDLVERLDASWEDVCAPCASAPRTLVHGDFGRKNIRIRRDASSREELVALDWETAGWGPPSADIPHSPRRAPPRKARAGPPLWRGTVPLDVYAAHACGRWDGPAFQDLMRVSHVGTVFRSIASIRWALEQVCAGSGEKAIWKLRWYTEDLPRTLDTVNW